jgi:hypothetical protein
MAYFKSMLVSKEDPVQHFSLTLENENQVFHHLISMPKRHSHKTLLCIPHTCIEHLMCARHCTKSLEDWARKFKAYKGFKF